MNSKFRSTMRTYYPHEYYKHTGQTPSEAMSNYNNAEVEHKERFNEELSHAPSIKSNNNKRSVYSRQ